MNPYVARSVCAERIKRAQEQMSSGMGGSSPASTGPASSSPGPASPGPAGPTGAGRASAGGSVDASGLAL